MPRTKQQRPRHILDENKNEDSTLANDLTSDGSSSPADPSQEGEYTTDSGISNGYSQHPNGEISDCSLSANSDCERGTTSRDDAVENDAYHRYAADIEHAKKSPFHLPDEQSNVGIERPFVNAKVTSATEIDGREPTGANYMEMIRSVIAQNMMNTDNANSSNPQPILNADQRQNFQFFSQNQYKEAFKNGMMNQFQVLTKLFQESIKYNQESETTNGTPNMVEKTHATGKAEIEHNSMLKMAAAQSKDHITGSYPKHNSTEDTASENSKTFEKDEHELAYQTFRDSSISPQSSKGQPQRATSLSPTVSKKSPEGSKNEPRYPVISWHGAVTPTGNADVTYPTKNASPSMAVADTSFVNKVAKPSKVDTPPHFKERETLSHYERQRRSPYERALYQTSPLYNTHRRNGRRLSEHERLLSVYPYHSPNPHPAFPLPFTGMRDFSRHPYYNPWGLMYPPYHPALPSIAHNPFIQQFPNDSMLVGSNTLTKPQGGLPQRVRPPDSAQSAPKKAAPRSKSHSNNPLNTLHDAIVREAKEMNKGMDPENMYIECPICHKRIKRLYHFQRHMRIHSGEKSHTCPYCPYKSVRKDNLKSHMKTHDKSKYDGSRRVQNRRDSQSGPNFSLKTDMILPTETNKKQPNASSPLPNGETHSLCKNPPVPSLPYMPQQKAIYNQHNGKVAVSNHTTSIDFSLIASPRYYHDARFPYGTFPSIPPFMQASPIQRPMRESQAFITELSDENSRSPMSRKSSKDESSRIDQRAMKRRSLSPTESEPKRARSVGEAEPLMRSNSNNNNNVDVKPPTIHQAVINEEYNEQISPKHDTKPRRRESSVICPTKSPLQPLSFQDRPSLHYEASQNGDSEGTNQLRTSNADGQKTEVNDKRTPDRFPVVKIEDAPVSKGATEPRIEGTFLSFPTDVKPRNFTEALQIMPARKTSSSSLDSAASIRRDIPEEGKPARELKSDLINPNAWNILSRESKCRLCDFVASSNSALQEHMSTHKEDGQYKCPQCEYHGKNLSKLIEHIRIHTGERPFQCDQCSYAAKRKDNLAQHKSVKHDKTRNKGPTRVLKLSAQEKIDLTQTAEPVTPHSDYASILYGRNPLGQQDWPYLKSSKSAERLPCFPDDFYSKLRNLPFNGHLPFAGVIAGKSTLNFSPNFLTPSGQHPSHNNLSSTTTM